MNRHKVCELDGLTLLQIWIFLHVQILKLTISSSLGGGGIHPRPVESSEQSNKCLCLSLPGSLRTGPQRLGCTAQFHPGAAAKTPAQ